MTDTTQPHPEPSEEASSLPVVAWLHKVVYTNGHRGTYLDSEEHAPHIDRESQRSVEDVALTPLADAQSQLNAMSAELERKSDAIQKLWKERDEARAELAALKSDMADMLESVTRESLAGDKARAELAALKAVAPAAGGVAGFDADDMTVPKPTAELQVGDYVFACRWGDGEPGDPWAVGWIDSISLDQPVPHVSLSGSKRGWRRAMKITEEQGHRICSLYPLAEPLSHQERLAARAEAFGLAARLPQAAQKEGE